MCRITAESLEDLAYGAAMVGESYDFPRRTSGVNINDLAKTEGF